MEYYIVIEPSGEFGLNKAPALLKVCKEDGESKLQIKVISDQNNITTCINKNFMSYLNKQDVLSYIRKDGGWKYYRVYEPKEMDEYIFKNDPFNWQDDICS
jgi:hypothetical protein